MAFVPPQKNSARYAYGEEDGSDDGSGSEESENDSDEEADGAQNENETADEAKTDSDENSDSQQCPICLARFRNQSLGTPDSCDHTFCLECIVEWSKNRNTCPIDRTEFYNIRSTPGGKILKTGSLPHVRPQLATRARVRQTARRGKSSTSHVRPQLAARAGRWHWPRQTATRGSLPHVRRQTAIRPPRPPPTPPTTQMGITQPPLAPRVIPGSASTAPAPQLSRGPVTNLDNTERGEGGFGSTGTN